MDGAVTPALHSIQRYMVVGIIMTALAVLGTILSICLGGFGMFKKSELERLFRDARAGLGNPPLDDVAIGMIGRSVLGE